MKVPHRRLSRRSLAANIRRHAAHDHAINPPRPQNQFQIRPVKRPKSRLIQKNIPRIHDQSLMQRRRFRSFIQGFQPAPPAQSHPKLPDSIHPPAPQCSCESPARPPPGIPPPIGSPAPTPKAHPAPLSESLPQNNSAYPHSRSAVREATTANSVITSERSAILIQVAPASLPASDDQNHSNEQQSPAEEYSPQQSCLHLKFKRETEISSLRRPLRNSHHFRFFPRVVVITTTLIKTHAVPKIARTPNSSPPKKCPTITATTGFTYA